MSGSAGKVRADNLLVESGLAESRTRAQAMIMAGVVLAGGDRVEKAGQMLAAGTVLTIKGQGPVFVSRGGEKLSGALADLGVDPAGLRVLDVGASTGGFTDCLLRAGARESVAVDVGYGQLHWSLRQDPRVTVLERTNARYLTPEQVGEPVDLAVIDVSFISIRLILPAVAGVLRPGGLILAMVKPQFEAGPEKVGRGGVVRDPAVQAEAVEAVAAAGRELGLEVRGSSPARIKGPKGNQEHFLLFVRLSGD